MSKRKRTAVATSTPSTNITWPAFNLAELFTWADNELSAVVQWPDIADVVQWPEDISDVVQWPDISDVVQPSKWDETGAISSKVELP